MATVGAGDADSRPLKRHRSRGSFSDALPPGSAKPELLRRTLRFAVSIAAELEWPDDCLRGGHTVGEGYFYELRKPGGGPARSIAPAEMERFEKRLKGLIDSKCPIYERRKSYADVVLALTKSKQECAVALCKSRVRDQIDCYECEGKLRLDLHPLCETLGPLADGYAIHFDHNKERAGFVASYVPSGFKLQTALLMSHRDHRSFSHAHGVPSVGAVNALQQVGRGRQDYILHCEFRQEGKFGEILAAIAKRAEEGKVVKVICVAGPTSSGKTTFATKLCMYLGNKGYVAKALTVDHYYLPLDRQPKYKVRQQRSDVDYDHIESMDVDLVGEQINKLVSGETVMTPIYDMKTGYRKEPGKKFDALPPNGILVIEGIHALNPLYTQAVDAKKVFRIFISPLTSLQLDDHNAVKTTNHRLLRRMCRDYLFRGNNAATTLGMWDNVRKGEGTWIYPHQNNADFVMNSAADYEIHVLKTFIEPLLRAVEPDNAQYAKAVELLQLLDQFNQWPPHLAPPAALLREFIGEGAFDEH